MSNERAFLPAFNTVARIVGAFWILGGVVFLVSAFVVSTYQVVYAGVGSLLLIAGVGFLLVKPATQPYVDRAKRFVDKIR